MGNIDNLKGKGFDKHPENINRKGRPKNLPGLAEALENLLNEEKDGKTALDAIVASLFNRAMKGDVRAIQELLDRAYGKVTQKIDATVGTTKEDLMEIFPTAEELKNAKKEENK